MLNAIAAVLLVPPVNLALLALTAVVLGRRRLAGVALALLLLLALPEVSGLLLASLETGLPVAPEPPQAIVVLGGDVVTVGPDGAQDIGPLTLERLRRGAALAHETNLPVLVTSGVLSHGRAPLADLMADSLKSDFSVPVRWIEPQAHDTWDNAQMSAAILRGAGITSVYVVTHGWHMRRALIAFRQSGLAVTPAPVALNHWPGGDLTDFIPLAGEWRLSYFGLHEWIGCAWYAWRARG